MQTTINKAGQPVAVAGQLSDNGEAVDVVSRFNEEASAEIAFGVAVKPGSSRRGGTDSKLRIGNFITFSGAPGIWGPISANSVMLAVAEINRRVLVGRLLIEVIVKTGGPALI